MSRQKSTSWAVLILGSVVLAEGMGKLLAPVGYAAALSKFDVIPPHVGPQVAALWTALEILSGLGLLVGGATVESATWARHWARASAFVALALSLAYAALTLSAYRRGLAISNCTCFGIYLPQRLSAWVLFQDLYMIGFCGWQAWRLSGRWRKAVVLTTLAGDRGGAR